MTKADLLVLLDELQGVDEAYEVSVKVTEKNQVGFLSLAAGSVSQRDAELLTLFGANTDSEGVWYLDLRGDFPWGKEVADE